MVSALIAGACAAGAVWLAFPLDHAARARRLAGGAETRSPRPARLPLLSAVMGGLGCLIVMPLPWSIGIALATVLVVPRAFTLLQARESSISHDDLARQAPLIADLIAATMASGAPIGQAIGAVARAVGEPGSRLLVTVEHSIALGADPAVAWEPVLATEELAPIAEAVMRSMRTGAPMSRVLERVADDLRTARHAAIDVAARRAGVRAVAPLAACFLPAFLLVGVVPVVASLATGLIASST